MFDYDNADPMDGMLHHFDTLFQEQFGYIHVALNDPAKDTEKKKHWDNRAAKWPERRKELAQFCLAQDSLGLNVYYGPAIFDIAKYDTNKGFGKENLLGTYSFWSEYDGDAPSIRPISGPLSDATPNLVPSALEPSEAGSVADTPQGSDILIPPPSLVIQSGHDRFEHHYWISEDFITDVELIEKVNRRITYASRADTSGWDANQVLRVPYTHNYKYTDRPPVTVAYAIDKAYKPSEFEHLPPVQELISRQINVDDLPDVSNILYKYERSWSAENLEFFKKDTIPTGDRSTALMNLGYICAEIGLNEVEIYAMLDNADLRWGKYANRADRKKRLLDIVNRALIKHPAGLAETTFEGLKTTPAENDQDIVVVYDAWAFHERVITEPPWDIPGFLEKNGIAMIAGSPGVGKTQISLQMGYCCALGLPFLKWTPRQMKTLVLSLEMADSVLKMFVDAQIPTYAPDFESQKKIGENYFLASLGRPLILESAAAREQLRLLIEEYKPELIIIDSLGKLTNKKLDEEVVRSIFNRLVEMKVEYNCSFLLVHHNRKANADNKRPNRLDDIYGSTYITADCSTVVTLWKDNPRDDEIWFITNKMRAAETPAPFKLKRGSDLLFSVTHDVPTLIGGENGESGASTNSSPNM